VSDTADEQQGFAGDLGTWTQQLAAELARAGRPADASRFAARVPPGYQERTTPAQAAGDIAELRLLDAAFDAGPPAAAADGRSGPSSGRRFGGRHRLAIRPGGDGDAEQGSFRLRRFGVATVELTSFLPVLESFGLVVVEAVPFRLSPAPDDGRDAQGVERPTAIRIDDFGVRLVEADDHLGAPVFDPSRDGDRLVRALEAVAHNCCDVDSLNRLVTLSGLEWTQVMVMRAYRRYWSQTAVAFDARQLEEPLGAHPALAAALVSHFEARFDPARVHDDEGVSASRNEVLRGLDAVPDLNHDRVLRGYLALIDATVRTSYFRPDGLGRRLGDGFGDEPGTAGRGLGTMVVKLDSSLVPDLPAPRPRIDTWVHGPTVEGIHLRAGLVARGGIRWSDRPDDFRTEVLDLAMAQVKKNAIIVPTGAKGGFVCRRDGAPSPADVQSAYEIFIGSLLDITDNFVAGAVVVPDGVVALDGPDPYLVVAADKGTASFSDVANALSAARGFWLGDAFASGGSRGYDHKAMGITAKGAWVAVRRHFHQLGVDVQSEPIRVVGVGDMSGDVFGNGMLRSESLRLVAAFDHRHIFVDPDPDPDPAVSFAERRRLAALDRSSWADYNPALISGGGGVWSRRDKRIALSAQARRALGVDAAELSPPELISAVLGAPADLLWFGGIGTYIKAPGESDADVADHANDAVRITSDQVRVRVIAEGGNLGVTQAARIRYSRRGGRINTDFIDNAAGVATSDREVNLKILLALAIDEGQLDPAERDAVLAHCEDDVAAAVLRQVDHSVSELNRAVPASAAQLDAYEAFLIALEAAGLVDRVVEDLPSAEEFAVRRGAGAGLIRPELAVVLAYAKSYLVAAIEGSTLSDDAALDDAVQSYFPLAIRQRFAPLIRRHRLYPELLATDLAGEIVDQMGVVWAHETAAELGRDVVDVAAAFAVARHVLDAGTLWADLEARSSALSADAEQQLHQLVADAVGALARGYLRRRGPIHPGRLIAHDRPLAMAIAASPPEGSDLRDVAASLLSQGVDAAMVADFVGRAEAARLGDASEVSTAVGRPLREVLEALGEIDRAWGIDRLTSAIYRAPATGRWAAWQARALLDDVSVWRRAAVQRALSGDPAAPVEKAVAVWLESSGAPRDATAALLAQLDPGRGDALTLAALVLRCLNRALQTD
jgi:glutamate dehydrogenase